MESSNSIGSIFRKEAREHHEQAAERSTPPHLTLPGIFRLVRAPGKRRERVPVILQLAFDECGAACLAMILSFYGRKTAVSECRQCLGGGGRDGLSARTIAEEARRFGLRAKGYSLDLEELTTVGLPAIIHWNFNHFVVLEGWGPQGAEIVDPAVGRRRIDREEFSKSFTGVVLVFEPGLDFAPRTARAESPWRKYVHLLLQTPGSRALIAELMGASALLMVCGLLVPLITWMVVDHTLAVAGTNLWSVFGIGIVVAMLTLLSLSYLRAFLMTHLQAHLDKQIMVGFFEHLLALPFPYFRQRPTGDLLMRLNSNSVVREILTSQAIGVVLDGSLVVLYLVILLARAPQLGVIVLGIAILQIGLLLGTQKRMHSHVQRHISASSESQSYLVDALAGIEWLKAAGREAQVVGRWSDLYYRQLNAWLDSRRLGSKVGAVTSTLETWAPMALLWAGAYWVLQGTMSLGSLLAFTALATAFLAPVASLVASGQEFQLVGAHLERLDDVLEAVPEQDDRNVALSAPALTGRIELHDVSFRYNPAGPWVLRDVSLTIEAGQKVALVGRSGAGKSTLALLLLGLYSPEGGEVCFDDHPLPQLDRRALRSQIGVVLQDPSLFDDSVRRNIALGNPDLTLADVEEAARLACLHDEIMQMPMRYETPVGERGAKLSGGQRQRLALARALASQPRILVLDEATSHLDVVTEQQVDENLDRLACTRLVIAHRLSTIRNANLILVLDQGTVVDQGSHEELLNRDGLYAGLVRQQLAQGDLAS